MAKSLEQAALAVDEMFNLAYQTIGDDSGEESEEEGERRDEGEQDEEAEDSGDPDSPVRILSSHAFVSFWR